MLQRRWRSLRAERRMCSAARQHEQWGQRPGTNRRLANNEDGGLLTVAVGLLWFYVSTAQGRRVIGTRAARAFRERQLSGDVMPIDPVSRGRALAVHHHRVAHPHR